MKNIGKLFLFTAIFAMNARAMEKDGTSTLFNPEQPLQNIDTSVTSPETTAKILEKIKTPPTSPRLGKGTDNLTKDLEKAINQPENEIILKQSSKEDISKVLKKTSSPKNDSFQITSNHIILGAIAAYLVGEGINAYRSISQEDWQKAGYSKPLLLAKVTAGNICSRPGQIKEWIKNKLFTKKSN
jgi:hypothetical protein